MRCHFDAVEKKKDRILFMAAILAPKREYEALEAYLPHVCSKEVVQALIDHYHKWTKDYLKAQS